MGLRLGFHYHTLAKEDNNGLYMISHMGRFIDGLAKHCESVVCFLHTPDLSSDETLDYCLKSKNVHLVNLGPKKPILYRELTKWQYVRPVQEYSNQIDAMLIRGPSPMLYYVANAVESMPVALLLGGDYLNNINDIPQPRWRREVIRVWAYVNKMQQMLIAKRSLVLVNNRNMFNELSPYVKNLVEIRTTTLEESDFYFRTDTCAKPPYRILYTGQIAKGKGVYDIIAAVAALISVGEDLYLDLVGAVRPGEKLDEFISFSKKLGIDRKVFYHGYQTAGPDLFEFYKQADIYVTAPQSSEGFPRTIWEAMAHCLPVIATNVGGIPDNIDDAAILVGPKKPDALAQSILKILKNKSIRQRNINLGFQLVKQNTLEIQSRIIIREIEDLGVRCG